MAKSAKQKLKLLYLKEILMRKTDEEHPINATGLISELNKYDIEAERKSIYNDLECLADYGVDLMLIPGRDGGYFVGSRDFELPELKLLVDAVQSSRFITNKKSDQIIKKLSALSNIYEEDKLKRQVYSINRIKSQNESVIYVIDEINSAIQNSVKISFQYLKWSVDKKLVPKHDGKTYIVSPIAMVWDDEYYYLVAYDNVEGIRKHFRIDKIKNVSALKEKRELDDKRIDIADYSKKMFGMFGGKVEGISILCPNEKVGIFIDRLGTDISVIKSDEKNVRIHVEVALSPQFFGWITSLGNDVKIIGPESIRDQYVSYLKKTLEQY